MDTEYALSRDISTTPLRELLHDYLIKGRPTITTSSVEPLFADSLEKWLSFFGEKTICEYVKGPGKVSFQKSRTHS